MKLTSHRSHLELLAILILLLGLTAACDLLENGDEPAPTAGPTPTPSAIPPTPLPLNASTAARVRANGYVRVGVRYDDAPFGIVTEEGDLIGFDVDLAHALAERWLGDPQAVRFVQVTDSSVGQRVANGQVDLVVGALPHTKDLAADMDFSVAYAYDGLALLVHARSVTNTIPGPAGLDNVVVAVVEGSGTDAPLQRATRAQGVTPVLIPYPNYYSALVGLQNESVGAVVGPRRQLERLAAGVEGVGLTSRFTQDPYALGLPKNDGAWRDLVNATLMGMFQDGSYQGLFEAWFEDQPLPELEIWPASSHLTLDNLSPTLSEADSSLEAVQARGWLVVGLIDGQFPFSDFTADGAARGFEAELARALADRWLGSVTAVQFVTHTAESGIAALQAGQIDLLAGALPHTLADEDRIDFSQTFYQDGVGLLVRADEGINSLADLPAGAVAVPGGGVIADLVSLAAREVRVSVSTQTVADPNQALSGLSGGSYQAYADRRSQLLGLAYERGGLIVLDERLTERPIAFGLRQGDSAFRDLVNFSLQAMAADGSFAQLYAEWFGSDPPYPIEIWMGQPYLPLEFDVAEAP